MKYTLLLFCLLEITSIAFSQNITQLEYSIDIDGSYGNSNILKVTPQADGNFPFTVDLSTLAPGFHKLYIRTRDSDGKWSLTTRKNIEVLSANTKNIITDGEYFIDADPGFNKGMPIAITSPDSVILQQFAAVTSSLTEGFHKLYGRLKDNNGNWSLTFRRNIEVYNDINSNINNAEYFFKTDKGFGQGTAVVFTKPAADGTFSFNIPLSEIPEGADTLFIRVQGSGNNRWSFTQYEDVSAVLPLTLLSFTAVRQNDVTLLKWQTASEINTADFNVQRSADGTRFATIGQVPAKGSSNEKNDYTFVDNIMKLLPGKIYYRLQMTDLDGSITYSPVRYVDIVSQPFSVVLTPNPLSTQVLHLSIYTPEDIDLKLALYNMNGKSVLNEELHLNAGHADKQLNLNHLSPGIYLLRISNGVEVKTFKIVKQ